MAKPSIIEAVDNLPESSVTTYMLRSLDFVVPGEWENLVGFENSIAVVTGKHKEKKIKKIRDRALDLYNDSSLGYQQALWLYQTVDRADTALGAAALANKVSEKIGFLGFLNKLTPKADTTQTLDLCLKIAVEAIAYSKLHGIPNSPTAFATALSNYHNEAVMRMAALVCVDAIIPLGPDFIQKANNTLTQMSPAQLETNPTFQTISSAIPGKNNSGKLNFLGETFTSVQGWMNKLVASRNLNPQNVLSHLKQFIDIADDKLDYVAAFLDMSTNYFEHTGTQTVARNLILRAAEKHKD
ncbi:hypothetical protein [Phormidium sp. CCY1219]|uniref:hypothetical protein n=1 Tax=Phormidium sp. CCY1219 TaxID=2886104 RepID=UPI002D1F0D34|nr:hypothetical protein [Phormidium sp. CCY1219]MEB3828699.1 hypothetical protein [Phormidium sp. CCY1219]